MLQLPKIAWPFDPVAVAPAADAEADPVAGGVPPFCSPPFGGLSPPPRLGLPVAVAGVVVASLPADPVAFPPPAPLPVAAASPVPAAFLVLVAFPVSLAFCVSVAFPVSAGLPVSLAFPVASPVPAAPPVSAALPVSVDVPVAVAVPVPVATSVAVPPGGVTVAVLAGGGAPSSVTVN